MLSNDRFITTRQFAESLGVSESSVKRWVDDGSLDAHRTSGGHRRIPLAQAARFLRRHRWSTFHPDLLPFAASPALGPVDEPAAEHLFDALSKDDPETARAIISGRFLSGADVATIGDLLIRPAMARIGELWNHDPQGVLVEHRAVDTCIAALHELIPWLDPAPEWAPTAVTAAGPADPYMLPPLLASLTLRERGFKVHNLGPLTPLSSVTLAITRYQPTLLSLSVSTDTSLPRASEWEAMAKSSRQAQCEIVVGGRCVGAFPFGSLRIPVNRCGSMLELGAFATGLSRSKDARKPLAPPRKGRK